MIDLETVSGPALPAALESNLRLLASPGKVHSHFLDLLRIRFQAASACLWLWPSQLQRNETRVVEGDASLLDPRLLDAFAAMARPSLPHNVILTPLWVAGRRVGLVGIARAPGEFELGEGQDITRLASVLGDELGRREQERVDLVLDRIKDKVAAQLRPRDLAYRILDGLLQLLHYDHSGTLVLHDPLAGVLRIEAEKVVWTKGKSPFIGHEIAISGPGVQALTDGPTVRLFPGATDDETQELGELLGRLLGYHRGRGIPEPASTLLVSLSLDGELLGLLKLASASRPPFDEHDAAVVERFLPAVRYSLRNVRLRASLESKALQAETRASLVTVARAVAHDVNTAVATILLRAEQALEEAETGELDPVNLRQDLAEIIDRAALCKRIFGNMLRVSPQAGGIGPVDLDRILGSAIGLLEAAAAARHALLVPRLAGDLPPVRSSSFHLQHIVFNLVTNALDAGARRIVVSSERAGEGWAVLAVADDGPGIAEEIRSRVTEPFFSTKGSTGLGLAICRSLAGACGGSLSITSAGGEGTRVAVRLPFAALQAGGGGSLR